jgi:hypothetical protein
LLPRNGGELGVSVIVKRLVRLTGFDCAGPIIQLNRAGCKSLFDRQPFQVHKDRSCNVRPMIRTHARRPNSLLTHRPTNFEKIFCLPKQDAKLHPSS